MQDKVKNNFWIWLGYFLILIAFLVPFGDDELAICCFSGIFILFIGYYIKGQEKRRRVFVIQNPIYRPSPIQVAPTPAVQNQPSPPSVVIAQPNPSEAISSNENKVNWEERARNLEIARDWEKAAEAYQKAGLYSEAGRIRKDHLEKEDSQVKIHVDRIGHNIQDSVYMEESDKK